MSEPEIDGALFDLYDEYCHTGMKRREFLERAAALAVLAGVSGAACAKKAESLLPDYARTMTVAFTDPRIKARYVTYDSPGGSGGTMRGYLVTPAEQSGPRGAVLVVHENRGLNPYVQDVARRVAVDGFVALAPDALFPVGGYPGNDEDGKELQRSLDPAKILADMVNSARFVAGHSASNGRLGVTGFCFGGGVSNDLATELGESLHAAAPFYGRAPELARVPAIRATLALHFAEDDPRVNELKAPYEAALTVANVDFESHVYPGTRHGFHNNSTPRYVHAAATLAWTRTIDLFKRTLTS